MAAAATGASTDALGAVAASTVAGGEVGEAALGVAGAPFAAPGGADVDAARSEKNATATTTSAAAAATTFGLSARAAR